MYLIDGQRLDADDAGFGKALAEAHATHQRPLCLCRAGGIPMYVARFGAEYLIKRMPCTGSEHAPACPSYELPSDAMEDDCTVHSAVLENPTTGLTTVRLDFALSRWEGRSVDRITGDPGDSVSSGRPALDLAGLLRYLWNRSELNRWQPGFAGKRSWAVVRRLLLSAAASSVVRGELLQKRLFVPEPFAVERHDEIRSRRTVQWATAAPRASGPRRLLLLCGEIKELARSRHGCLAIIKHLPDQPFSCDECLYRRFEKRFEQALSLWDTAASIHLVAMATFGLNAAGVPSIDQLALMPVDEHWIPVRDLFEVNLLTQLVCEQRRFIKILATTGQDHDDRPSVALTDTGEEPVLLHIAVGSSGDPRNAEDSGRRLQPGGWVWHAAAGQIPHFPAKAAPSPRTLAAQAYRRRP